MTFYLPLRKHILICYLLFFTPFLINAKNNDDYLGAISDTLLSFVVSNPPIAKDITLSMDYNLPVRGNLRTYVTDSDSPISDLTFTLVQAPRFGEGVITIQPTGAFQFVPKEYLEFNAKMTYAVCDADFNCDTATITIIPRHVPICDIRPNGGQWLYGLRLTNPGTTDNVATKDCLYKIYVSPDTAIQDPNEGCIADVKNGSGNRISEAAALAYSAVDTTFYYYDLFERRLVEYRPINGTYRKILDIDFDYVVKMGCAINGDIYFVSTTGIATNPDYLYRVSNPRSANPVLTKLGRMPTEPQYYNGDLAIDRDGDMWYVSSATRDSFITISEFKNVNNLPESDTPLAYTFQRKVRPLSGLITLNAVGIDDKGGFYIGSKNNIWYLNLKNGRFKRLGFANFNPTSVDFATCDNPGEIDITGLPPVAGIDNYNLKPNTAFNGNVGENDTDADNNISSFSILTNTRNGNILLNPDGKCSYTPNNNFIGRDSFTYVVCDLVDFCDTAVAYFTVKADITLINDAFTTNEDTPLSNTVATNDFADGINTNGFLRLNNPTNGTIVFNSNGTFIYTPNPNFFGRESIDYQACNNFGVCDTATLLIDILPINDQPLALDDSGNTNEDTPLSNTVANNDLDIEGLNNNSYTVVTAPRNGTINLSPNGNYTYTPNPNFSGLDSMRYRVCDNGTPVLCAEAWLRINVSTVNDPPIALNDRGTTNEDTPLSNTVANNDSDIEGLNNTSYTVVSAPRNGTINLSPNGSYIYTPNPNYFGLDSMRYRVCDNGTPALCVEAALLIDILSINDQPLALDDRGSTNEEAPLSNTVANNDSDIEGLNTNSYTVVSAPKNGIINLNPNGSYTYTPNPNFSGLDSMRYRVCDNGTPVLCAEATLRIEVLPINRPPVATNDAYTMNEDATLLGNVALNDSDRNNNINPTSFRLLDNTLHGVINWTPQGNFSYTPFLNYHGIDSVHYEVCDLGSPIYCSTATIIITIQLVNDRPIVVNDVTSTNENTAVNGFAGTNDSDVDNNLNLNAYKIIIQPKNGSITMNPNGFYTYQPNTNFNGIDSVQYEVCDLGTPIYCDRAWIIITVNPINEAPIAGNDIQKTLEDTPLTSNVSLKVSDTDNNLNKTSFRITKPTKNGSINMNTEGVYTYQPKANFNGIDTAEYEVCDLGMPIYCAKGLIIITIEPVNDPPSATVQEIIIPQGNTAESCYPIVDIDANDSHTAVINSVQKGSASTYISTDGKLCVQYKAPQYYDGKDTITIMLCDRANACVKVTIPVTVIGCNDLAAPTIKCPSAMEISQLGVILKDTDSFLRTASIADNCQGVKVNYNLPTASDDCTTPTVSLKTGVTSGGRFAMGVNTLVFEAKDIYGKTSTCQTEIMVMPVDLLPQTDITVCAKDTFKVEAKEWLNANYAWRGPKNWLQNGRQVQIPILDEGSKGNYIVSASYNGCKIEDTLKVNVKAMPVLTDDRFTVKADESISDNVIKNDILIQNEPFTARIRQSRSSLIFNNDGSFRFTPQSKGANLLQFEYEVCYKSCPNACTPATAQISVEAILQGTNIITPNGDGKNDNLTIIAFDATKSDNQSEMIIFNQWGDIVFKTSPYQNDWDGIYNGKPLPAGTYYYIFKENPDAQPIKNFVTIMR